MRTHALAIGWNVRSAKTSAAEVHTFLIRCESRAMIERALDRCTEPTTVCSKRSSEAVMADASNLSSPILRFDMLQCCYRCKSIFDEFFVLVQCFFGSRPIYGFTERVAVDQRQVMTILISERTLMLRCWDLQCNFNIHLVYHKLCCRPHW